MRKLGRAPPLQVYRASRGARLARNGGGNFISAWLRCTSVHRWLLRVEFSDDGRRGLEEFRQAGSVPDGTRTVRCAADSTSPPSSRVAIPGAV
ncbi:unnamed protein product [Lampetra planeri]